MNTNITDLNNLIGFLAKRDLIELNQFEINKIQKPQVLILMGNSSLFTAECAFKAYKGGLANTLLISGGIGHSTKYLVDNIKNHRKYSIIQTENRTEADILGEIAIRFFEISEESLLVENKSTNCGTNASESMRLLEEVMDLTSQTIILMQDPILQRRTQASFEKISQNIQFFSYASFVPYVQDKAGSITYSEEKHSEFCDIERLLSLVMGEIPRLNDDSDGYGPNGKRFIVHVDIPGHILLSFNR